MNKVYYSNLVLLLKWIYACLHVGLVYIYLLGILYIAGAYEPCKAKQGSYSSVKILLIEWNYAPATIGLK